MRAAEQSKDKMESLVRELEEHSNNSDATGTKDSEPLYVNVTFRNQDHATRDDEKYTRNKARGSHNCQIPPGRRPAGPISNNEVSVRAQIENKLLEEICQSPRTPGLYERQRTHSGGARYLVKRSLPERSPDSSPFIRKMDGKLRRDMTFYGEDSAPEGLFCSGQVDRVLTGRKHGKFKRRNFERNNGILRVRRDESNGNYVSVKSLRPRRNMQRGHLCSSNVRVEVDPKAAKRKPDHKVDMEEKIKLYNRGINMEAFLIKTEMKERKLEFQGVLRFYLEEEGHQISKAIRLRNTTTVRELLPLVKEKFMPERHHVDREGDSGNIEIFLRRSDEEITLGSEDRPLDLALHSHSRPRFIVQFSQPGRQNIPNFNNLQLNGGGQSRVRPQGTQRNSPISNYKRFLHRNVHPSHRGENHQGQGEGDCITMSEISITSGMNSMENRPEGGRRAQSSRRRRKEKKEKKERRERSLDRLSEHFSFRKGSLRLSRSMTNLVHKTFSLRQKDNPFQRQSELSTEETAPGVLKIFGDTIIPGAEYKSVLATPTSTAKELAKEALERYGISRRQVRHYVLCDVIGKFVPIDEATQDVVKRAKNYRKTKKGVWLEECLRVVSDNERPLTIQEFWKPTPEFSRRFELRKRSELVRHTDTFTSGINANARRLLLSKAKLEVVTRPEVQQSYTEHIPDPLNESFASVSEGDIDGLTRPNSVLEKSKQCVDKSNKGLVKAPAKHPYFLTLKSYDSNSDNLLYVIRESVTMVGRPNDSIGEGDICLHAPDILAEHCWISQSIDDNGSSSMTIDPLPNAAVRINDNPVTATTKLHPGDLISMGEHYVFLYKSPSEAASPQPNFDFSHLRQTLESTSTDFTQIGHGLAEDPDMLKWRRDRQCKYDDSSRLKLNFTSEKRDVLISYIMTVMDKHPHAHKLTIAYLVSMCVDYSLAKHDIAATRNLISALSSTIQNVVWEATKELADKQANLRDDDQGNIHNLMSDLHVVHLWLANAVELHFFFRKNVRDSLRMSSASLPRDCQEGDTLPEEEIVGVLEDVVMYSFQQTVYYLTKALYAVLPAVLESNPFINDVMTSSHSDLSEKTVDAVISIFHSTLTTMTEFALHPHIVSQLFCYLFFFTSTSLFNMLMKKDAGKYYKWSRGAQLRGNLDALEAWAAASGLGREAQIYMNKINTIANLLATPKVQLLTASWHDLQRDFPSLKNEQLLKVLSEYDVGQGKDLPEDWAPPDGAIDPSIWSTKLQESFSNYPPLRLPKSAFTVNLNAEIHDELLIDITQHISSEFGVSDDDRDSGLSVSQTLPAFSDIPHSPVYFEDEDIQEIPITCHAGSTNCSTPRPIPPKRRSREERRKALSIQIPNQTDTSPCESAATESPGSKQKEPDLGDSGISMSCGPKDYKYEDQVTYTPVEIFNPTFEDEHVDNCNASQAFTTSSKTCLKERSQTWSHDKRGLDPDRFRVSHHRHASEKVSTKPQGGSSFTCTGPLAMSSPVTSDVSTPSPSPIDRQNIPPQPRDPAPTLDRSSLKKKKRDGLKERSLAALNDESKVVEIKHLMPPSPDGVVNGLRVLPLSDLEEDVSLSNGESSQANADCQTATDLLRTIEGDKRVRNQGEDDGLPVEEEQEDVIIVNLVKGERGLGLGLIDGLFTPLRRPGIYVRTLVLGEPAEQDGRLQIGDRILAVNGKSLVGSDYQSAMKTIRESGTYLRFLVAQGNRTICMQITASSC